MFKNDISYSTKQKAIRFTEDSKNFLVSLNEALVVLKEKAFLDNQKVQYVQSSSLLLNHFNNHSIIFPPRFENNTSNHTLELVKEDKNMLGIATYCNEYVNNLQLNNQMKTFESLSLKLDK